MTPVVELFKTIRASILTSNMWGTNQHSFTFIYMYILSKISRGFLGLWGDELVTSKGGMFNKIQIYLRWKMSRSRL